MADNVTLNAGTGGATLAADDVSSVWYQRVKLTDGTADSTTEVATGNGTSTNALRVTVSSDTTGVLSVDDNAGSLTVDNGGTFVVQEDGAALTALQLIDDVVHVDDTATHATGTTKGALIMGAATPTDGSVDANDIGAVAMSTDRRLHVDSQIVGQDADVTIADGGNSITVDNAGTFAVQASQATASNLNAQVVGNVASAATDSGNPVKIGAIFNTTQPTVTTGQRVNLQATNRGALIVASGVSNVGTNIAQMNGTTVTMGNGASGTGVQRVTVASDSTGALISNGNVAHDAVNSGNPLHMGARATNSIEGVTQVANADRTSVQADLNGVLISRPHTTLEEIISERVSDTAGTSTDFTNFAAGGAGIHNYVTTISIYNSSATDGYVDIRDGSAGSIIFTCAAPATGGSVITFPVPLKGAANTALAYDVSGALSTVYISVVGFQAQG